MSSASPNQTDFSPNQALAELERRHVLGESTICESILAEHPELHQNRDAVLELIYLEFVLCEEAHRPISADSLRLRFPEYQADLQKILSVDRVFRNQADTPVPSDTTIDTSPLNRRAELNDRRVVVDHLGDYELLEILGRGGMGVVYRARQRHLNRLVAVKTIDILSSLNPAAVARFHNEAELVAKLQHPNIVQVYEVGSTLGVPFFSMELVSGGTLAQAIQERPMVPVTAAKIVETLARAVHYAHCQSVVHRDLKPANILLSPSDRNPAIAVPVVSQFAMLDDEPLSTRCEPKIADFGLAKFLEGAIDRTATQGMIGTPSFMAPEQIDPELGTVGPACDIYSLGAILYDAMTGRPPFNAPTVIETIQQVRSSEVIPPSKLQAKIPRDLETICLKCLLKEPAKRYQTASELADELQRFLSGQPILARPQGMVERSWKWARLHPSLSALFAAVLIASIGMTILWLRSEHSRLGEQAALQRNDLLIYDRDIALAQFEYDTNRIGGSREILEKTRPDLRGWEWDYLRNQSAASIWESPEQLDLIHLIDISPDGRYVAWVNREKRNDPESITVWDLAKNQLRWRLESDSPCNFMDVRFNSEGSMLLSASYGTPQQLENSATAQPQDSVALWDLQTGTLLRTFPPAYSSVARFSRDGKSIFVGTRDAIEQYAIDSGEMLQKYHLHHKLHALARVFSIANRVLDLDFNPDGSQMVVTTNEFGVAIWDVRTGEKIQGFAIRLVGSVDWSPDGQTIHLTQLSGTQRLYQLDAGVFKLVQKDQHRAMISRISPDGRRSVSNVRGQPIEIRSFPSGELERSIAAHNGRTLAFSFDSSGRYLVTGGADKRAHVWDLSISDPRIVHTPGTGFLVSAIEFNPTGTQMVLALSHVTKSLRKHRLEIREVETHKLLRELTGHTEPPTCVAFSPDDRLVLSGSVDKSVRLWDAQTSKQLSVLMGHEATIIGVAFMKDKNIATSIDEDGVLKSWNLDNQTVERTCRINSKITGASFHSHHPLVAVATKDERAEIWDTLQGKQIAELPAAGDVGMVCFSPDGLRLATVNTEPATHVWLTEELLRRKRNTTPEVKLGGHTGAINCIDFSPDGRRLISSSQDLSVRLFDVIGGRELIRFGSMQGNDSLVRFSPDGKNIVRTLVGDLTTWKSVVNKSDASLNSNHAAMVSWHKSEAAAAEESQNWFAAQFHLSQLMQFEPDAIAHLLKRARLRILLGNFIGAENDLCACADRVDQTNRFGFMRDLARAYLGQRNWAEYHGVCNRLLQEYGDSSNPAELSACLWLCTIAGRSKVDATHAAQKLESMMLNPRFRQTEYLNALALFYYRKGEYHKAISCAQNVASKIFFLDNNPGSAVGNVIIALSYAQLDQQRFGWLPRLIQQKIREWRFSSAWNSSLESLALVDAWFLENEVLLNRRASVNEQPYVICEVDLPQLKREWEEIAGKK